MQPLLEYDDVALRYHSLNGEVSVLEGFSLTVKEGEFVALLGPSGCGKSTLLSLAAGLLKADKGRVLLRGKEIDRPPRHMGYMLQHDALYPWLTVRENAALGLRVRGIAKEKASLVEELLDGCGLSAFKDSFPQQLSGGMRQRVALARTLAVEPDFLLLDEPFSALDAQTRIKIADEVKMMIVKRGSAALLVSHDVAECVSMADRVVVLTNRPARIRSVTNLPLKGSPMERRNLPEFRAYFDALWKELDVHVE